MNVADLSPLHGRTVVIKSTEDHRDPPVALQGSIDIGTDKGGGAAVRIVVEFPDMNNRAAHHQLIPVEEADLARLLASEHDGIFEYTIDRAFDSEPTPGDPSRRSDFRRDTLLVPKNIPVQRKTICFSSEASESMRRESTSFLFA